jgi:hypothetical protein
MPVGIPASIYSFLPRRIHVLQVEVSALEVLEGIEDGNPVT